MSRERWQLAGVVAVAVAVAAVGLFAPFTYDDKIEVIGNPAVRAERWWLAILAYNPWRTLVLYTYAVNWQLGGLHPLGYHVVSIGIHAANAVLAWRLLRACMAPEKAMFATALWAAHPMTTEAVTYTSGRSDALVATWTLLACERWLADSRTPNARARCVAVAATGFAAISKETWVVIPVLLFVADWALVAGGRIRLLSWRRYLPFVALGALGVAARVFHLGWPTPEVPRTFANHTFTQAEVWVRYLQLWLLPWGQSIIHAVPPRTSALGVVGALAWLLVVGYALRKRGPWVFWASLWALPLLVSSGFVLKETMAEHRAYLPGLGLAALISWRAPWRLWAWIVPAIFASLTVARNLEWQDETKLWRGAALRWSDSADVWYGYGDTLRFAARWAEAEAAYSTAATLDPARPDPWVNLGVVRAERGDEAGATRAWEQALVALPGHCAALNNLAALALKRGAASEAIDGFEGSLVSCPDDATAHYQLGILYAQSGDQRRAIFHLRAFLAVDGNSPGAASARTLLQRLGESP